MPGTRRLTKAEAIKRGRNTLMGKQLGKMKVLSVLDAHRGKSTFGTRWRWLTRLMCACGAVEDRWIKGLKNTDRMKCRSCRKAACRGRRSAFHVEIESRRSALREAGERSSWLWRDEAQCIHQPEGEGPQTPACDLCREVRTEALEALCALLGPMAHDEVGALLGLSGERARQIEAKALDALRRTDDKQLRLLVPDTKRETWAERIEREAVCFDL